jgi:hypothetical protein
MGTFEIEIYSINKKKHLLKGDATVEPLIFIHNLTLMIDEHGDEGEDIDADEGKSEGEDEDVNTIRVRVMVKVPARVEIRIRV